ncbi:MAG TPA: hypothetical protein VGI93_21755 [Steroidobacteraceae bacterium]|jgi:hypothetical protein
MRAQIPSLLCVIAACALGTVATAADQPPPDAAVVDGTWQHHKVTINYFGITSLYSCYGLEDHVKDILLHFGARKDAKVRASGCPRGPDVPSRTAFVYAEFDTLAPAEPSASNTVKAYWASRALDPRRPFFMGDGDCELVQQMKDTLSKSFSLKDLSYDTDCVPHEITINSFQVKASALVAIPTAKTADNLR